MRRSARSTVVVFPLSALVVSCGARTGLDAPTSAAADASLDVVDVGVGHDASNEPDVLDVIVDASDECPTTPTPIASETEMATAIVVSGDDVYWMISGADARVRRARKTGSPAEDVLHVPPPRSPLGGQVGLPLAVDALGVFYSSYPDLFFHAFADGSETRVLGGLVQIVQPDRTLIVSNGDVLWGTSGSTVRLLSLDGSKTTVAARTSTQTFSLTADDRWIYWTEVDSGRVRRTHRDLAGDPVGAETLYADALPYDVAVDDRYVYWTHRYWHEGSDPQHLSRAPLDGGGAIETLADRAAFFVAADGTNVYWSPGVTPGVSWLPKGESGTPRFVVARSTAFAVEMGCLYFQSDARHLANARAVTRVDETAGERQRREVMRSSLLFGLGATLALTLTACHSTRSADSISSVNAPKDKEGAPMQPTPSKIAANPDPTHVGTSPGGAGAGTPLAAAPGHALAAFAEGCFWGSEETFRHVAGVTATAVGYTGGHTKSPTYESVCTHTTGHAETVLVEFDPKQVSYEQLLLVFWKSHDPTQGNRQGPDVGDQYRSAIWTFDDAQAKTARASKTAAQKEFDRPITTEIAPIAAFWIAEDYHQQYDEKNGGASCGTGLPQGI